jgi:hypothetical protein
MRKRPFPRSILLLPVIALLLACVPAGLLQAEADATAASGYVSVMRNGNLELLADTRNAYIALKDERTGRTWYSNPPDLAEDTLASGMPKALLMSLIGITYQDGKNNDFTASSVISSVKRNGFTFEKAAEGLVFLFDFVREQIRVPVRFSLEEEALVVQILSEDIEEYGGNRLVSVTLMPYFGAGGKADDGYLLVPDGSGAIIRFNNGRTEALEYDQDVYGDEYAVEKPMLTNPKDWIHLPVFGIRNGQGAMLGVIDGNAAAASISAFVAGRYTSYNTVNTTFHYRIEGSVKLPMKNWATRTIQLLGSGRTRSTYSVRYLPLQDGSTYIDMANRYGRYLKDEKGLAPAGIASPYSLFIDTYASVRRRKSVLGIPMTVTQKLAGFDEMETMLADLKAAGIDSMVMRLNGWTGKGAYGVFDTSGSAIGQAGGERGLASLLDKAADLGTRIYPSVDLTNSYEPSFGFVPFRDATKNLTRIPARQYAFLVNTLLPDYRIRPWYLTAPSRFGDFLSTYLGSLDRRAAGEATGVAVLGAGSACYSDFSEAGFMRAETEQVYWKAFSSMSGRDLMLESANAYGLSGATSIISVPLSSSRFDIFDESVPFYEAALRGYAELASPPVNLSGNPRMIILKCLEYGVSPTFAWTPGDPSAFKETRLRDQYASDYRGWMAEASQWHQELEAVLGPVAGQPMTAHERIREGVFRTTFGETTTVLVNYGERAETVDGSVVPPMGYLVLKVAS